MRFVVAEEPDELTVVTVCFLRIVMRISYDEEVNAMNVQLMDEEWEWRV